MNAIQNRQPPQTSRGNPRVTRLSPEIIEASFPHGSLFIFEGKLASDVDKACRRFGCQGAFSDWPSKYPSGVGSLVDLSASRLISKSPRSNCRKRRRIKSALSVHPASTTALSKASISSGVNHAPMCFFIGSRWFGIGLKPMAFHPEQQGLPQPSRGQFSCLPPPPSTAGVAAPAHQHVRAGGTAGTRQRAGKGRGYGLYV